MPPILNLKYPVTCTAWPDASLSSRTEILEEWGRRVGEETATSWDELVDVFNRIEPFADDWVNGYWMLDGWQILLDYEDSFGGLREVYRNLGFPVVEWTYFGTEDCFDLDVMVQLNYFYAHVVNGVINPLKEGVVGTVLPSNDTGRLLSMTVPDRLVPHLAGMSPQIDVFSTLSSTLRGLGLPANFCPIPNERAGRPKLLR